ncbi:hypothetical protein EYC84_004623 [Monilinia fructicola]|uniref:Uncharacterized protein n=1 Tax=Monilinia fructicola TaxID=38448 RepID=A0A5M9K4V4_MONFR|nr:hypothetical protein EYC84_004623 [Monilinia fructicola]
MTAVNLPLKNNSPPSFSAHSSWCFPRYSNHLPSVQFHFPIDGIESSRKIGHPGGIFLAFQRHKTTDT